MATVTAIASAVAARLNAAAFTQPLTAEVVFRPIFDLKNLRDLKVSVVPLAVSLAVAGRGALRRQVQVDIGIQRRLADESEIGALLDLVEEVTQCFGIGGRLPDCAEAVCTGIENEPVYAPEHIEQYRQFTSVVTLTFEVVR